MKLSYIRKGIAVTCVSLVLLSACNNNLDIQPENTIGAEEALETSSDVEALLVGAYDALGDEDLYGGNILRDAELLGDAGELFWDGTYVEPEEVFAKRILTNNEQVEDTWNDAYEVINMTNNVLNNLSVVNEASRDRVEGEAKFLRGLVYFELVRFFAQVWTDGDPASNLGVPLVLTPTGEINEENNVARNTVAEVYAQILSDLTEAEELLPASNGFFATKDAAAALLSRVYMMQQNYIEAASAADRVISSGRFNLVPDYAGAFNNSSNTPEDIFAIQVTSQDGSNNMNEFFGASENGGRGDIIIEDAHLELYETEDERLALFYEDETELMRTGKWTNQFGNVNLIRLAEMYLTRAEANLRAGTTIGATPVADINVIRERAGLAPMESVTLENILRERRLELAFEGHLIHDIKRTRGSVGNLPYNAPQLVFPIPQRETDVNSALVQNEGY